MKKEMYCMQCGKLTDHETILENKLTFVCQECKYYKIYEETKQW